MLNENVDIEVIQAIKALGSALIANKTIFVSPDGDNSTGESWERAYTTIPTAIENAEADSNAFTLIMLSAGIHDINTSGVCEIDKNVIISNITPYSSEIKNTHASATGIFKITKIAVLSSTSFECSNNITALEFSGTNVYGSKLSNIVIGSLTATAANSLIKLTDGARGIMGDNIILAGNESFTTGLDSVSSVNAFWDNIQILFCLKGIHLKTGTFLHSFNNLFIFSSTTGLQIDAGVVNILIRKTEIIDCTTEIINNGTAIDFQESISINEIAGTSEHHATAVLYVSPNGEDVDGKTWKRAFVKLQDAIDAASSTQTTQIILDAGEYDIDTVGSYIITKQIILTAASRLAVGILNNNAGATGVFTVNDFVIMEGIRVDSGTGNFGIIVNVGGAGSSFTNILVSGSTNTAAVNLFEIDAGEGVVMNDVIIFGNPATVNQTGLAITNATQGILAERLRILYCVVGISMDNTANALNGFRHFEIDNCTTAISIAASCLFNIFLHFDLVNNTTEITDNGVSTTIKRDIDVDTLAGITGSYTEVLYLSPNGDNSDGKSWSGAFTTLLAAYTAMSSNVNDNTLLVCSPGTYDVNITGDPTFTKTFDIRGSHKFETIFKNDHVGATSVFKLDGLIGLENLTVDCGSGTNNGVLMSIYGSHISNVHLHCEDITGAQTALEITGDNMELHDIGIHGSAVNTTGIKLNGASGCEIHDCFAHTGLVGIHLDGNIEEHNHILNMAVLHQTTGILIDAGANDNQIQSISFNDNTTNITDNGTDTDWIIEEITQDIDVIKMYPAGSNAGVNINNAAAAAGVYGGYQTLVAASQITTPFKIVGIGVDNVSDGNAMYFIDIAYGAGDILIATLPLRGGVGVSTPPTPPIKSGLIPANSRIRANIQTSNGGNDNLDLWIQYVPY